MTITYNPNRMKAIREHAESDFEQSWLKGRVLAVLATLTRTNRTLRYLGDLNPRDYEPVTLERQAIPLHKIQGTNGRLDRFDRDFHPILRRDKARWTGVASGMMNDPTQLPPLELVQVGDVYYVLDGHHRVSVARSLGKLFIDANVIQWQPR